MRWAKELTPAAAAQWNATGVLRGWSPWAALRADAARAVLARLPASHIEAAAGADGLFALRAVAGAAAARPRAAHRA